MLNDLRQPITNLARLKDPAASWFDKALEELMLCKFLVFLKDMIDSAHPLLVDNLERLTFYEILDGVLHELQLRATAIYVAHKDEALVWLERSTVRVNGQINREYCC